MHSILPAKIIIFSINRHFCVKNGRITLAEADGADECGGGMKTLYIIPALQMLIFTAPKLQIWKDGGYEYTTANYAN